MSVYAILCDLAEKHSKIVGGGSTDLLQFDLENKSVFCGRKAIIDKGKLCQDFIELTNGEVVLFQGESFIDEKDYIEPYNQIEILYGEYRKSVPSKNSDTRKSNFIGLSADELTFEELRDGESRILAGYKLEGYILFGAIERKFPWKNEKHWFWKSENVPGLILYKKWLL